MMDHADFALRLSGHILISKAGSFKFATTSNGESGGGGKMMHFDH